MENRTPYRVVSFLEACAIVHQQSESLAASAPPRETVALLDGLSRVLAEPVLADRDQPPFPRSTRDGFACRAADVAEGLALTVHGMLRAGESSDGVHVGKGGAMEIMTGAPIPAGADAVIMVEHVQRDGDTLRPLPGRSLTAGENIVPRGAEALAGATLLPRGVRMAPAHIAVAASCGAASLSVFARPRVAIVATGDELVELDQLPLTHQIRNSNSYSLAAQVVAAGAQPVRLPVARDELGHLEQTIRAGLESDLLLLSGGVSMGKYDLVEDVLLSLGAEFFFTGARIQPGKPVVFGRISLAGRSVYFFGLPGNPVSTMVTFSLFVEPLLAALCGQTARGPRFALARLGEAVAVKAGLTRFLPAVLTTAGLDVSVQPIAWQGSGDLANTSRSNCFLVVPPDSPMLAIGDTVTVLLA